MGLQYRPEMECKVFLAVKELGEATTDEVHEFLEKQEKVEIEKKTLIRYLRRWKAKKIFAANYHDQKILWKLADIPPWYASGIMAIVKGTVNEDMRTAIDALDEKIKNEGRIIEPRGVWGGYRTAPCRTFSLPKRVELTFETLDPILGGWLSEEEGKLRIPRVNGKRFIPANWFKGWTGSNAALFDLPQSIRFHIAFENAVLPEFEAEYYQLKVKTGLCKYEAIPVGTQFTTRWAFPLRGCKIKTLEDWRQFVEYLGEHPLRGLGANPYALGGRVKLIDFKQIDSD